MHRPAILIAAALLAAAAARAEPRLRFVFITTCVEEQFFKPVEKGMREAAAMLDVDCAFTGTTGVDVRAQAEMVRQAVRDGVDGIALNIIDPVAFDDAVREAVAAGVPVVAFNVDDHATPNARLAAVNQRLYEAGRTLGQACAPLIPDGSHILMTMHAAGVSALEDRLRGAQEALTGRGITWTVAVTGNSPAESGKVIGAALEQHPDIRFVLCTGQADTEGAGLAIEERPGRGLQAAGFDLSPGILRLLKAGAIRYTVDQQPYVQGFYPVVQLALLRRYGIRPASLDAGAALVEAKDVGRVEQLAREHYR